MSKTVRATAVLAIFVIVSGCQTVPAHLTTPEGFAEYTGQETAFRAITPEGVVLRVRSVPNEPEQNLDFWTEALEVHMSKEGYILLEKTSFSSRAGDGAALEWSAPYNGEDWVYLTAIAVGTDTITIAEAAGEHSRYRAYRESIFDSLSSLTPAAD